MVSKNIIIGVLSLIIVSMVMSVGTKIIGSSSLIHDTYIPRRALIIENYPVRLIFLGEWSDINRTGKIGGLIKALNTVKHTDGSFEWNIDIKLGQEIQSGVKRETNRKIDIPYLNKD